MKTSIKRLSCLCLCAVAILSGCCGNGKGARYSRHIIIAPSNALKCDKRIADFVCDGVGDEQEINKAIERLPLGGTIQLLDGDYYLDSFDNEGNSAIYFGYNNGNARTITITGTTENKAYNTRHGAVINVSDKAWAAMDPDTTYRVAYGAAQKPEGDFFKYTHVNNVNFENLFIMFPDAQRKAIGLDCRNFGGCMVRQVGIFTKQYFDDRFLHLKPAVYSEGLIGIYSMPGSNDEMARVGFDTIDMGGLYVGIYCDGIDHLIMNTVSTARCVYGYIFEGPSPKTLTMINCCDEGNTHLPLFKGWGHLTCIDFNIERFNADYIPDDILGNPEHLAVEEKPGGWMGFISYTLQGKAFDAQKFWADGCGKNFKTVNLNKVHESF